jgi:glycosyltransferase involved in cell wall biosynthesis
MDEARVTVGMPVYNDPDGLRRSVPTIFGQTWRGQLRLVVVDDGSTDETPEVLASLAAVYGRIDVIRHPENKGRPYARNKILELAGDDYLAWIDAGDLWHPRKLELQLAALRSEEARHPGTAVLCTGPLRWAFTDRGANRVRVPDVAGDQLRGALVGALFPYLQGIVCRASHLRDIGGFDTRLLRRQDYDMLVRFVGEGGRVVSSPDHVPVFTYLKSDIGTSPELVAAANKVIRQKHQPYYRRYGRRIKREIRGRQDRLVARFYQHNGRRVRSLIYRMREKLWHLDPFALFRRSNRTAKAGRARQVKRLAGLATLLMARPALLLLGRSRTVRLAQLVGFTRLLASTGTGRDIHDDVKLATARGRRSGIRSGFDVDEYPAWIAELEAEANAAEAAGVESWLRLERAYRERGLLHSAESALRRGLELHPDDEKLLVRLVELLPLRQKWEECVGAWARLPAESTKRTGVTHARVARSLRELGRPAEALAVAMAGVRGWPGEVQVRQEVYLNRATLVDWSKAMVSAKVISESDSNQTAGTVTDLGFLAGDDGPIRGWIRITGADAPVVTLVINGRSIATTSAGTQLGTTARRGFALSCHDVLPYLGDGDLVSVECAGRRLRLPVDVSAVAITTGYESRFAELVNKLDSGFVFTKFGRLKLGATAATKAQTLALYDQVAEVLREIRGYPVFPFYGNLLGAIREHDIISHDVGGFDMGYVSNHHDPERVRAEFVDICRALLDRGYHLRVEPWSVYVRTHRYDQVFVDVNYAWFTDTGELNFSFGWRHSPVTDRERFFYPRESLIGNHLVRVPGNAEQVLEQLYGPSWPVPDQGFALDAGLQRTPEFLLTLDEMLSLEQSDPDRVDLRLEHHPMTAEEVRVD